MKSSMWLKLEVIGLCLGLFSTSVFILIFIFGLNLFGVTQELFRGGEPLAIVLGTCLIFGLASCLLFFINLLFKRHNRLWLRLLGFVIFLISIAVIGNALGI